MDQPVPRERFVGTWKLVAMRAEIGERATIQPYGPEPVGYLTYTADGHMHAILMARDRPKVGSAVEEIGLRTGVHRLALSFAELPALARHTEAAIKAAAYSGTWEIRGAEVVHRVNASLIPDWIGTELERTYAFDGDRMTLTARYPDNRHVELVWQRA